MIKNIALAAALVFGTASVALATEQDPNLQNRYPNFQAQTLQSAPVSLQTRDVSFGGNAIIINDRASSPNAGGVG
jgi:hypothetical protein